MNQTTHTPPEQEDRLGAPLAIISFLVPIVGIVLYFLKKDQQPRAAKTACYAVLLNFAIGIVIFIIAVIGGALIGTNGTN